MEVFWVFTTLVGGQHILNILHWIAEMMQKVTTKSLITMKVILLEFWASIDKQVPLIVPSLLNLS